MKKIINSIVKLFQRGFNDHTGYFYYARIYHYEGTPQVGYVICEGYRYFWLNGHSIVDVACDKESLNKKIEKYKKIGIDISNWSQK